MQLCLLKPESLPLVHWDISQGFVWSGAFIFPARNQAVTPGMSPTDRAAPGTDSALTVASGGVINHWI